MAWEDNLWMDLVSKIKDRYGTIWPSVELFGDALRCFSGGGYEGACVMCRASVEALLHLARTRGGVYSRLAPETTWGELNSWASSKGLLKGIKKKVDRVHKSGNFAAHKAQKIDAGYTKIPLRGSRGVLLRPDKELALRRILETFEIITMVTERRWP